MTIHKKLLEMLDSVRFWQATGILGLQLLAFYKVLPQEVINYISAWLGVGITVRTVDKAIANIKKTA